MQHSPREHEVNFKENPADICVIAFSSSPGNDHFDLISRCLKSIVDHTDPQIYRLHIGCNNLSPRAMAYVDQLVSRHGATKYVGAPHRDRRDNVVYPKAPLVRRIFSATSGDWVIHFDDDVYVTQEDWLPRLEEAINRNRDVDQFGIPSTIFLPLSIKEEWIDPAGWSRPGMIQYRETPEEKMIVSPFILGGFYALSRKAMTACRIPDERLFHNYDDWTAGMALLHNGYRMGEFRYGICFGDETRRGIHNDEALSAGDTMTARVVSSSDGKLCVWEKEDKGRQTEKQGDAGSGLPSGFSAGTLEKNLAALMTVSSDLVRRICLPVDDTHIRFSDLDEPTYQKHRSFIPFLLQEEDIPGTLERLNGSGKIFLFGIGLGEQLDYLLQHYVDRKISVWDRDPWLIRLALMRQDYSKAILSGRLRLGMCADIMDMAPEAREASVIAHPFFRGIYENEFHLLDDCQKENKAVVCAGGLLVDDVEKALREMDYALYRLDMTWLSIEEISTILRRFNPRFLFSVNYRKGLAELCEKHGIDLLCWEIDPSADHLTPCEVSTERTFIFNYRMEGIEEFRNAGFSHVEFLPLAADPEKRAPAELSPEETLHYSAPISFVGSSMIEQANTFRNLFLAQYRNFRGGDAEAAEDAGRLLEDILSEQRRNPSVYQVPELLNSHFRDFIDYLRRQPGAHDPFMLAGEIAAAEKRLNTVANLGFLGIKVWGDEGWKITERYGASYMGAAGHHQEINKIYGAARINLDINRIYQPDIATLRVFDILSCGGFVLAERSRDLEVLFVPGQEIETYGSIDELKSKAEYYLEHEEEAEEIAEKGRDAVLKNHTVGQRVRTMLEAMENNPAEVRVS